MTPRPALVTVNYGAHALLAANLPEVPGAEIVVVDNFSSTSESTAIETLCTERGWHLVRRWNDGFGAGANAGIEFAWSLGCRSAVLVNPDAVISSSGVDSLVRVVEADPSTLAAPVTLRTDGSVWSAGGVIDRRSGRVSRAAQPFVHTADSWLSGACLAFGREWWQRVGGFSDGWFLYWEDVDLSFRWSRAGGRLAVIPEVVVTHDAGGTQTTAGRREKSSLYYRYNCRNRLVFGARHLGLTDLGRWLVRTPSSAAETVLRGGRRQLLRSPRPIGAAVAGVLQGIARVPIERLRSRRRPAGPRRSDTLRIYGNVRTAHLERLRTLSPSTLIYHRRRYDFDESVATADRPSIQMGRVATVLHLLRRRHGVVELNEPFVWRRWPDLLVQVGAIRLRCMFSAEPTRVVAYCIGLSAPEAEIADRFPWAPKSVLRPIVRRLTSFVIRRFDALAFGTEGAQKLYGAQLGGGPAPRSAVFEALPTACDCAAATRSGGVVLFVGAFVPRKGIRELMATWDHVDHARDGLRLVLVGKGPLLDEVQNWAATRPSVSLEIDPPRTEIHRFLRSAELLVLLSQPEGSWREQIGLPILEGLGHGLTILTTEQTGLAHWLDAHGHTVVSHDASPEAVATSLTEAVRAGRSAQSVLDDLPQEDQRVVADNWLLDGRDFVDSASS